MCHNFGLNTLLLLWFLPVIAQMLNLPKNTHMIVLFQEYYQHVKLEGFILK